MKFIKTLCICLLVWVLISVVSQNQTYAVTIPAELPYFGIGVSALPDETGINGWMPDTKIPFDYAYQYLAGGVNTGSGWETWGANGIFALNYARNASSKGYIPVFTYYDIYQSKGTCDSCGEAQKDLSNLNNNELMKDYYQNFILLMKRMGSGTHEGIQGYGKKVIIHIEPDLTGYAHQAVLNNSQCYGYCSGQGNNPTYLKAAVSSTKISEISDLPNTFQGFNWALLKIRDTYAPNVIMAFHQNGWSTGTDINSDPSSKIDAQALGEKAADFINQSGIIGLPSDIHGYDLIFNDVLDRDAAYFKYVRNNPSYFWDRDNVLFPNFIRWEQYISSISSKTEKSIIVWQIPEGNQYFLSVNNTDGHYQDNRAEYFFSHIDELKKSGIIGLLFGAGNAGSTFHFDYKKDGITNPQSICTKDGTSGREICNNNQSQYADDDGGYIRIKALEFYRGSVSPTTTPQSARFSIGSSTVSPSQPQINTSLDLSTTITNNGSTLNQLLVDMEVYDSQNKKVFQKFYNNLTFNAHSAQNIISTWTPAQTGSYTLKVGVFSNDWSTTYAWNEQALTFTVSNTISTPTITPTPSPTASPTVIPTPTISTISINVWWPSDGATVSGIQPFKAVIDGVSLSSYTMYWQVDGGSLVQMNDAEGNHKEAMVDLKGWTWKGTGPYTITFVVKDLSGNIIARKSVNITITQYF